MTEIAVELGCDCRIRTSFVGARFLALDIADRDAARRRRRAAPENQTARGGRGPGGARGARGLRGRDRGGAARPADRAGGRPGAGAARADRPDRGRAAGSAGPGAAARRARDAAARGPGAAARAADPLEGVAALDDQDQIEAVTVYDRDDAREIARRAEAAVPDACLPMRRSTSATGPPSRPGPRSARPCAPASSASSTGPMPRRSGDSPASTSAPASAPRRGRCSRGSRKSRGSTTGRSSSTSPASSTAVTPAADGPLALDHPCPGRHALWLALGGVAPAFHDAAGFADVEEAFAELPAELRARLGPRLIGRLLDAARPAEARRLLDAGVRSGDAPDAAMRLAEARCSPPKAGPRRRSPRSPGSPPGAARSRLEALVRVGPAGARRRPAGARDRGDRPARRGARAPRHRRASRSCARSSSRRWPPVPSCRRRCARRGPPPATFPPRRRDSGAGGRGASPPATRRRCGRAAYVETVLGAADLIAAAPAADPARRAIAGRLVELGLPSPALRVVVPALAAGDRPARLVGARAQVALGRARGGARHPRRAERARVGRAARRGLRARRRLRPRAGAADRPRRAAAAAYAWPAGAWPRVRAPPTPPRRGWRSPASWRPLPRRAAARRRPRGAAPELAFREPLPDLARPSLDAARRLLAVGPKVGGLVAEALAADR